jgi:multiple sugar transport system substrate-binding protein
MRRFDYNVTFPRKRWLGFGGMTVVFIAAAIWLVACGNPSGESQITLRVIGEGYPPLLAFEKVKSTFENKTGIKVDITKRDHMAVVAEVDREFAAGNPTYDLVIMPHRLLGKFVEKGSVQPVDSFLNDPSMFDRKLLNPDADIFPGWWREISWYKSKCYGLPFMVLSMYTWYRKDLFESPTEQIAFKKRYGKDLKPPATWLDFAQLAEFFNRPKQGLYGTSIQAQRHIALWYQWLSFAAGFGARILNSDVGDEPGDIVVNSPAAVQATEFMVKMLDYSSPESTNQNWDDALTNFQQGRTALAIMWHDSAPWAENPADSKMAGKIGYAPPPSTSGKPVIQLEGHTFLIPSHARHPREAFKLMTWFFGSEVQVAYTLQGGLSPRVSTYNDPRIKEIPYMVAFRKMTDSWVAKPTIPEADQIAEIMTLQLSRIMTKELTPQVGLDQMALELNHIVHRKLVYTPANR